MEKQKGGGRFITSPGQLSAYLNVAKPGFWVVLVIAGCLVMLSLIWSLLGTMKTTITLEGIKTGNHLVCYAMPRNAVSIDKGFAVDIGGVTVGVVKERQTEVLTREMVFQELDNDYYASQLHLPEWNVHILIDMDKNAAPDGVVRVDIVLYETRPFDFLGG